MSHGRRMLEAQAQKERTSGTSEGGHIDDGHLRNTSRALNNDGTPVRSSRGGGGEEDISLLSPSPESNHRLGFHRSGEGSSSAGSTPTGGWNARASGPSGTPNHQPRISGLGLLAAAPLIRGPLSVTRRRKSLDSTEDVYPRVACHGAVDGEATNGDRIDPGTRTTAAEAMSIKSPRKTENDGCDDSHGVGKSAQPRNSSEARSQSRSGSSGNSAAGCLRYPVSRVKASARAANSSALLHGASDHLTSTRTESRSPPLVTTEGATLFSSQLQPSRAAPLPTPITASLCRPGHFNLEAIADQQSAAAAGLVHPSDRASSRRRESSSSMLGNTGLTAGFSSSTRTPLNTMSISVPPASPPLRAGVSPRTLPLHPTRVDASNASVYVSRANSANTVTTTVVTTPSSSQVQLPHQGGSRVSPYELQQQQAYPMPSTPPAIPPPSCSNTLMTTRSVVRHDIGELAGDAAEEDCGGSGAALHSLPRSPTPLPQKGGPVMAVAGPEWRSPLPSPLSANAEAPIRLPPSYLSEVTEPYDGFDRTPLTNSLDRRHYPFMRDFSGFHNTGNDCYGCSLFTMLLRSPVFRRALLHSPLVCAVRRYEALLTGKTERRVLWSSGYVETAEDANSRSTATVNGRKRTRGPGQSAENPHDRRQMEEAPGATARGQAGTAPPSISEPSAPSQYVWRPTPVIQHTLNVLDTFSLDELEDALAVDPETQHVPATLHNALAALARAQRWREHMTALVNARRTQFSERQRLLESRIYHANDRDFDGQVYSYGIRLSTVAKMFEGDFFLGDQEDAHELFVSVIARLEMEALRFQERCDEVLKHRSSASTTAGSEAREDKEGDEVGLGDERGRVNVAETPLSRPANPVCTSSGSATCLIPSSPADVAAGRCAEQRLSVSKTPAEVWINTLVQTNLLNIIRCRTGHCHHEIVTDEICVNLSVNIPEALFTSSPPPLPLPTPALFPALPQRFPSPPTVPTSSIGTATARPIAGDGGGDRCPSLADLLQESMAYEALKEYRCDSCGSTASQYQGGCFYTCPPPLLVLQLKRFATQFVKGTVIIHKNSSRVAVEERLVIHALPTAEELRTLLQRRKRRPPGQTSDSMGSVDSSQAEKATRLDPFVSPTTACKVASTACVGEEACCYYDPNKKCFAAALRKASYVGGGDDSAGQAFAENEHPHRKADHLTTAIAAEPSPPSRVWAIRCVYLMRSCVLHLGPSLYYGHYVSDFAVDGEESSEEKPTADDGGDIHQDVPTMNESDVTLNSPSSRGQSSRRRWRRANDERVEVLDGEVIQTRHGGSSDTYLLLYEKITEELVQCPAEAVLPVPVYPTE